MRMLVSALLLVAAPAMAAPVDLPVALPDGRTLNLYCQGSSGPVVLFDAGWAADSRVWRRVMAQLPGDVRACAADRAGQGKSSPGPMPRDGEAVARDLQAAATAAKLPGPWLLVGHSLGGLNMRHFVRLFPADVAGLLLLDPTGLSRPGAFAPLVARSRGCVAALTADEFPADRPDLARCKAEDRQAALARWEARLSEIESAGESTSAGLADQGPGSLTVPLIVLRPGPQGVAADGFADPLATLSAKGEARLVPGSGHMIMLDQPGAVVQAIANLLAAADRHSNDEKAVIKKSQQ
ncbi:alpha/beta fold hydrolase [Sandaracinobacter neustonicus]|nr:alpha/beta hydrolase [Sandaracinobacter neustonicus]